MISIGQTIEANHFQCPNRRFKLIKWLGKGGEGEVYLSEPQNWIENQVPQVALKFQSKQHDVTFIHSLKTYQQQNESQAFAFPSGMIKIFDIFEWNQYQVIVMEAGSTDLYQYIQSNYTEQEAFQFLQQLSYSVKFLHSRNLIHRDLKPENYIKVGDKFKLIDFGLVKQSQKLNTPNVGSPLFQAPEIVNNQQYSSPVDIWSLGCVFFEVLTKQPLCFAQSEQEQRNLLKEHLNNPNNFYKRIDQCIKNLSLQKLIKEMIHPEPSKRLTIDDVQRQLNSMVFSNFNQKFINNNYGNVNFQPKPQFNQINSQQQPFELQSTLKEINTQINQLKEVQQTQNNQIGLQLQLLFKNFEEKIETKINQKMFEIQSSKDDTNLNFKQFNESLDQIELNLSKRIVEHFTSLQQNLDNQQKIQSDQFGDYSKKIFEDMGNQLEAKLIKNNEEQLKLQNDQFQGIIKTVNQLLGEEKSNLAHVMKYFEENLDNLINSKVQTYEQVRVNQSYCSKFENQQTELQNFVQQISEANYSQLQAIKEQLEKLQSFIQSQGNFLKQFQGIENQLEQTQTLSQKSFVKNIFHKQQPQQFQKQQKKDPKFAQNQDNNEISQLSQNEQQYSDLVTLQQKISTTPAMVHVTNKVQLQLLKQYEIASKKKQSQKLVECPTDQNQQDQVRKSKWDKVTFEQSQFQQQRPNSCPQKSILQEQKIKYDKRMLEENNERMKLIRQGKEK